MRRFHFNILYQQLPESFEILVIFQPEASFMKSEFFFELLEYFDTERDTVRCSHQTGIFSIFMEVFKIPPHPDSNFCEELYAKTQCWYILVLGGAKLKFALLTPQSIPKAHSIKYFSLLKKIKVDFTSGVAAVCIQNWAMQSKLKDFWASSHTSMKQESLLEGCQVGVCLGKYVQPSWSGTELNSVPVEIFWLDSLEHISVALFVPYSLFNSWPERMSRTVWITLLMWALKIPMYRMNITWEHMWAQQLVWNKEQVICGSHFFFLSR